jgi:DUF3034 family protein
MKLILTASAVGALLTLTAANISRADTIIGTDAGKLLLTGGFSDLEGSGGGGLVPLAFITGYGTNKSWGLNAHFTNIQLQDFHLNSFGIAVGLFDRLELSFDRQLLNVTGTALDGIGITENVYGAKLKLIGDAVYQQNSPLPQIAVGVQYKRNGGIDDAGQAGLPGLVSPTQLGARKDHGTDYYLVATKIFLGESLVVNAALRYTEANQFGLLGFGGDRHSGYSFEPGGTIGYLISRRFAVGAEYRSRPHNLTVDNESAGWDVFAGWAPTKNISLVAAYLNLGSILAPVTHVTRRQQGPYISLQVGL